MDPRAVGFIKIIHKVNEHKVTGANNNTWSRRKHDNPDNVHSMTTPKLVTSSRSAGGWWSENRSGRGMEGQVHGVEEGLEMEVVQVARRGRQLGRHRLDIRPPQRSLRPPQLS